jgi:hypothetical protein
VEYVRYGWGDVFVRGDEKELRNELIFGLRNAVERLAGLP